MRFLKKLFKGGENLPKVEKVPIDEVYEHSSNPRIRRDEEAIESLAATINWQGLEYPIKVVREPTDEGEYGCFDGMRRVEAAKMAGREEIEAEICEGDGVELLLDALVSGQEMEKLNPIEEAKAYERALEEGDLTQRDLANRIGRTRKHVGRRLKLLNLPEGFQQDVAEGKYSISTAQKLARQEKDVMNPVISRIDETTSEAKVADEIRREKGEERKALPILGVKLQSHEEKRKIEKEAAERNLSASRYIYEILKDEVPL